MTTTTTSLRERALAAHEAMLDERRRDDEAVERDEEATKVERLQELLWDVLQISATPTSNEYRMDGIVFHVGYDAFDYEWYLYISQDCPLCDGNRISYPVKSLADLGAALSGSLWRSHEHYYEDGSDAADATPAPPVAPPTIEEQLLAALRAFVAANTPMGGEYAA